MECSLLASLRSACRSHTTQLILDTLGRTTLDPALIILRDPAELQTTLRREYAPDASVLICVDGASQSGKTFLAHYLAQPPHVFPISTDCYRLPGHRSRRYSDGVDVEALGAIIVKVESRFTWVVIEGVGVRDALELLGRKADVFVYCKRLSPMGVWNDDPEFTSPDEYAMLDVDEAGGQELVDYWSWEYHLRVRPHENSDYLVERVE